MGYGYDILAPGNITRVMKETEKSENLIKPLLWYERAAKPEASDDEMTLKHNSQIFAADIISMDARATVRDSGEFTFEQHGMNKIKHGFRINESMTKLLRRIEKGVFMDNEVLSFRNYIARRQAELVVGVKQRVETMINGMLADEYDYSRFGIKAEGTWGMLDDLKFVPVNKWNNTATSTPLTDLVSILHYADHNYNEKYDRITLTYNAVKDIVNSDEFNNVYVAESASWNIPRDTINIGNVSPVSRIPFLEAYLSSQVGWQVSVETDESRYREFSPSTLRAPGRFHDDDKIYFTCKSDDNSSVGWDVGNGEVIEQIFAEMSPSSIIGGSTMGNMSPYGPFGYATLADHRLNPPGMVMWCAAWMAPRRHRDTCSALLTIY